MKIVVIGGSGLIGSRLVKNLRQLGHEVVAASPRSGVNAVTGEGVRETLAGANVVVDVANSPSFEDGPVMEFFEKSTGNLLAAEADAGVGHHVALSVVGAERLPDSGYMRAKVKQERLIRGSAIPFTILRATQFFEFLDGIAASGAVDGVVRLPSTAFQPVAADDVAAALTDVAVAAPRNGMLELGGPETLPMSEFVRRALVARGDARQVIADPKARYFGEQLNDLSLVPAGNARVGVVRFQEWMAT